MVCNTFEMMHPSRGVANFLPPVCLSKTNLQNSLHCNKQHSMYSISQFALKSMDIFSTQGVKEILNERKSLFTAGTSSSLLFELKMLLFEESQLWSR